MDKKFVITGQMRVGKNAAEKYLKDEYGMQGFAFGNELKKSFHEEFPHIPKEPKPRKGYQLWGQLMRYVHGEDHWVDKCFSEIEVKRLVAESYRHNDYDGKGEEKNNQAPFIPLITDLRQPNEFVKCSEEGFIIIRINASIKVRMERMEAAGDKFDPEDLKHETETHIDSFKPDFDVDNNNSLKLLHDQLDFIMNKCGVKKQ